MIELTDEMREAFERAFEFATSDDEVVISRRAIRAGLAAVLALVERDYRIEPRPPWDRGQAGPCSEVLPPLLGSSVSTWCELPHGHTGDHQNGPTRWKPATPPQ